jgi:UDP-N-acetylmuramoylalanine--D-glutamate ligase
MPGRKNKKTLVVGLGLSGTSAAAFLARRGFPVLAVDSADTATLRERAEPLRALGVEVVLGVSDLPIEVDQVVTSPGVPPERLAPFREKKIPILGDLELGCREITAPIVAVTGTNGKSTVVTNIAKGLQDAGKRAVAIGNLGTPITEWVERNEDVDVVVIEVSSYQLETVTEFHPRVAVILNVAPDHLGHHGSMEAYVNAKSRIAMNQTIEDVLLLHRDLAQFPALQKTRGRLFWYGRDLGTSLDGLNLSGNTLTWRGGGPGWSHEVQTEEFFPHDAENMMACVASLVFMGVPSEQAVTLFRNPVRLPHRIEVAGVVNGVRYINDSKATNAHAVIAALKSVEGPIVWLVGGEGKGEDLSELVSTAREKKAIRPVCFGRDRLIFRDALSGHMPVEVVETMRAAFELAGERARPGETVLLSPACASFDEFKSFEDRGEKFQAWVKELELGGTSQ